MRSAHNCNYLLLIEYDGTDFSGWQKQPAARTVQEEIEKALLKLGSAGAKATAAGRTDKGVHANAQAVCVSFDKGSLKDKDLRFSLNSVLPKDISVISVEKKTSSFNPRFEAEKKKYRYLIWNRPWRSVWRGGNAWHIAGRLDTASMKKASGYLLGRHDFRAFEASGSTQTDKVANLESIDIKRRNGIISICFTGDRFLYKMVRNIVGTLVEAGRGKITPESLRDILASGNRKMAGPTAPPKGLFLEEVFFHEE